MSTKEHVIQVLLRAGAAKDRVEAERLVKEAVVALKSPLVGIAGFWR